MSRKKVSTTVYLSEYQVVCLRDLLERTRIPTAQSIRDGIDILLDQKGYNTELLRQMEENAHVLAGRFLDMAYDEIVKVAKQRALVVSPELKQLESETWRD